MAGTQPTNKLQPYFIQDKKKSSLCILYHYQLLRYSSLSSLEIGSKRAEDEKNYSSQGKENDHILYLPQSFAAPLSIRRTHVRLYLILFLLLFHPKSFTIKNLSKKEKKIQSNGAIQNIWLLTETIIPICLIFRNKKEIFNCIFLNQIIQHY